MALPFAGGGMVHPRLRQGPSFAKRLGDPEGQQILRHESRIEQSVPLGADTQVGKLSFPPAAPRGEDGFVEKLHRSLPLYWVKY